MNYLFVNFYNRCVKERDVMVGEEVALIARFMNDTSSYRAVGASPRIR